MYMLDLSDPGLVICTSFGTGWGEAGAMGIIEIGWRKKERLRVAEKSSTSPIRPLRSQRDPDQMRDIYLHCLGITIVEHDY